MSTSKEVGPSIPNRDAKTELNSLLDTQVLGSVCPSWYLLAARGKGSKIARLHSNYVVETSIPLAGPTANRTCRSWVHLSTEEVRQKPQDRNLKMPTPLFICAWILKDLDGPEEHKERVRIPLAFLIIFNFNILLIKKFSTLFLNCDYN